MKNNMSASDAAKHDLRQISEALSSRIVIVPKHSSSVFLKKYNISVSNYNDFPVEIKVNNLEEKKEIAFTGGDTSIHF